MHRFLSPGGRSLFRGPWFHARMTTKHSGAPDARPDPWIRQRTDDDIEACVRVLAEVHTHDGYPVNWPARPGDWLSHGPLLGSWVAGLGARPDGHVSLSHAGEDDLAPTVWSERNGTSREATAVLGRLFVAPRARGHRIGARLIHRAVEEARRRGLHPVLDVVASDTAAAALYARLGWERMATVEQRWSARQTVSVHCYAAPAP